MKRALVAVTVFATLTLGACSAGVSVDEKGVRGGVEQQPQQPGQP